MKTEASEYLSLLQEIQNNNVSTFTVMPADEPRFTIETNSRNIIVPSEFSFLSVQNDHRAETIYFEIDRYFDNVDLSQHACVVQFINKSGTTINEGTYPVTSMDIDSVDGKIVFGWEIRNDATQLTGDITFSVRFYSIDNNGNFTYNFNTLTASSYILPSLNIIASGERITATELEVWTDKINNLASSIESDIITVEEKIEELENYIASIPEDYTALTEEVGKLSEEIDEIKGELPHTNILNVENSEVGFAYKYTIGSDMVKVANTKYTACNQIFSVKEGEKYTINWLYGAIYLYDADKKLVSYNYADTVPYTLEVAQNGYMTVAGSTAEKNNIMFVKGDTLPIEYVEYGVLDIITEQGNRLENKVSNLENKASNLDSLNGVKWCAFGDSLTASSTLANMIDKKNYVDYVSNSLGLNVTNCGFGGTGFMKTENNFVNRVTDIPTDTEILTVFGSFNDYEYIESSLGVFGDSGADTIYGCMKSFFDSVFSRCPDVMVGVILPTKWGYLSPQKDSEASAKCDLYIKALTETAESFDLPILDLYNHSNLRPWEDSFAERYYKDDDSNGVANTVHPLDEAHKKFIAPKVEAFIKSIYRVY